MAFTLDPTFPADTQNPRQGALDIRNLTGLILQLFGQSVTPTNFTQPPIQSVNLSTGAMVLQTGSTMPADPTTALGIATKEYVDNKAGGFNQFVVNKTADQTVTNSTTFVSDSSLITPGVASAIYVIDYSLWLNETVGLDGGIKFQLSVPAGAVYRLSFYVGYQSGSPTVSAASYTTTTKMYAAGHGGFNPGAFFPVKALVQMSSTPGNITLQWAQATAVAGDTLTVQQYSSVMAIRSA